MQYKAETKEDYLDQIPDERKEPMNRILKLLKEKLPPGFEEQFNYGFPGYVVPLSLYPPGYHVGKDQPLPFINLASQKNALSVYHMGVYADEELHKWFVREYPKHVKSKLDMGKSCIRFKKMDEIPYDLLGELFTKMSPQDWINTYEKQLKNKKKR